MGDFVISPSPPVWIGVLASQQGLFAPRALPRFPATAGPSATLSPSTDFPVSPVIRLSAPWISPRDEEGFSSCLTKVRHGMVEETLKPCRISSGNSWVYTTFAIELETLG